ncbi:MAG: 30S ribosomal protein S12 methylthiotransferase RimO [Pseudomonadota bacterium]
MVRTLSTEYQPKIGLVSLGCPKATSDSEHIITRLRAEGYQLSKDYRGSHAVIVNTCGFLDSARAESLDAIGEAIAENGKVIVTGCLGKDKDVITKTHPKVLEVTGPHAYEEVMSAIRRVVPPKHDPFEHLVPETGLRLTPRHYAYLKISEGCNNRCSFCIIPSLRGNLASRPIHQVLAEATRLKKAGVKELLVISQDTSAYGVDLKYQEYSYRNKAYKTKFRDLCAGLSELDLWVRLHYVYPYPHVDDVLPFMQSGGILPYLDIPFQHFAPDILRKMKRPGKVDKTLDRILKWREAVPDLTIRSTFIVGFPGETEADFALMLDVLEAAEIDRAGCFIYEPVKGAASNDLENHIPPEIQQERYERFMLKQQEISEAKLARKIDTEIDVIIDDFDGENWIGRSKGDAPEIDGHVYLNGDAPLEIGDIVSADIYDADAYDLYGRYIDKIS